MHSNTAAFPNSFSDALAILCRIWNNDCVKEGRGGGGGGEGRGRAGEEPGL